MSARWWCTHVSAVLHPPWEAGPAFCLPADVAAPYAARSLPCGNSTSCVCCHALTCISLPVGGPHIPPAVCELGVPGAACDAWPCLHAALSPASACLLACHTCCLQSALWKQQALLASLALALACRCLLKVPLMLPAVCLIQGTLLFMPFTVVLKVQNASDTLFRYEVG